MKTMILLITFATISMLSCRPQRSAMLQMAQQSQAQFQQRQFYQYGDTMSRQWFFYTDSPFVYHPDIALIGRSGYLWFDESRYRSSIQQLERDSNAYEFNSHIEKQKEIKSSGRGVVWVLLLVLLFSIGVWWYIRCSRR